MRGGRQELRGLWIFEWTGESLIVGMSRYDRKLNLGSFIII